MDDELHDIAANLHSVSIRMLRTLRREDEGIGLSQPRLSALSVIVFAGPMSLAELAAAEQVKPPTMSRIVEALVEDRLVTRVAVPEDRRSVRIAATEKGRRLMEAGANAACAPCPSDSSGSPRASAARWPGASSCSSGSCATPTRD